MAYTVNQYTAICNAIGSGQLIVQYDGKRLQYQSMGELLRAKADIQAELIATGQLSAPSLGGVERGGTTFAAYSPD